MLRTAIEANVNIATQLESLESFAKTHETKCNS